MNRFPLQLICRATRALKNHTSVAPFSTSYNWSGPIPPFGWTAVAGEGMNAAAKFVEDAARAATNNQIFTHHQSPSFSIGLPRTMVQCVAPDFTTDAVLQDDSVKKISLSSYRGRYVILLFYPLDFTFVCPSELVGFSDRYNEFQERNCDILTISVDSHFSHAAWKKMPMTSGGLGNRIQFPMLTDLSKQISSRYGVLCSESTVSLRALFLIDKEGIIRHNVVNDLPLGRSVDEAIRMLDALQHYEKNGEVCPVNWKKGDTAMTPTKEGVVNYFASKKE